MIIGHCTFHAFIQFFYAPWLEAQKKGHTPRSIPADTKGHVIVVSTSPIALNLVDDLKNYGAHCVLLCRDSQTTLDLLDQGYDAVVGEHDSSEVYRNLRLSEAAMLVALDDQGRVAGYAGLQVILDEGYITNVAVRPDCRRQGVAGQILQVFLDFAQAQGLAFLTLEVRASNQAAILLYGSRGFRGMGRRKNYYEHPREDAIIMTKEFTHGNEISHGTAAGSGL